MVLKLTFDYETASKDEAKERGVDAKKIDDGYWLYYDVPGYQVKGPYSKEPWAIPGLTEFVYCNESLNVELAFIEDKTRTLILYHDCEVHTDNPVRVPIKAIQSQEKT